MCHSFSNTTCSFHVLQEELTPFAVTVMGTFNNLQTKDISSEYVCVCVLRYLHLLRGSVQSRQMVEVNLNIVKYGSKHLQHHPAHESSQERIEDGGRKKEEEKNLMTLDKEGRGTMYPRE